MASLQLQVPDHAELGGEVKAVAVVAPVWRSYTVGSCDSKGRKIDLILSHFEGYIIYEAGGLLQLEGNTDAIDKNAEVNRLLVEVLSVTPKSSIAKRAIYYQIAVALDICMSGNGDAAAKILDRVLCRATNFTRIKGQLYYLWGCISVASLISLASVVLRFLDHEAITGMKPLIRMAALGGIGGVLSVAINLRKLEVDIESGPLFNFSFGAARCMIAVAGALFIHLAIAGNLVMGLVGTSANDSALLALAMLAGFSETLVPNSLRKIEGGELDAANSRLQRTADAAR